MPELKPHTRDNITIWVQGQRAYPRPYISWSQLQMWNGGEGIGPDTYVKKYCYPEAWDERARLLAPSKKASLLTGEEK